MHYARLFVLYFLLLVFCILAFTYMLYLAIQPLKAARVFSKISQSVKDSFITWPNLL